MSLRRCLAASCISHRDRCLLWLCQALAGTAHRCRCRWWQELAGTRSRPIESFRENSLWLRKLMVLWKYVQRTSGVGSAYLSDGSLHWASVWDSVSYEITGEQLLSTTAYFNHACFAWQSIDGGITPIIKNTQKTATSGPCGDQGYVSVTQIYVALRRLGHISRSIYSTSFFWLTASSHSTIYSSAISFDMEP